MDYSPEWGFRIAFQRKRSRGEGWNKVKYGPWRKWGGVMVWNGVEGKMKLRGVDGRDTLDSCRDFLREFGDAMEAGGKARLESWIKVYEAYEAVKATRRGVTL